MDAQDTNVNLPLEARLTAAGRRSSEAPSWGRSSPWAVVLGVGRPETASRPARPQSPRPATCWEVAMCGA